MSSYKNLMNLYGTVRTLMKLTDTVAGKTHESKRKNVIYCKEHTHQVELIKIKPIFQRDEKVRGIKQGMV